MASISLWIRPEPFDYGIIPMPPPSKLGHHNLRKLFAYAKNKGKAGYPKLSYGIWRHVACNKLQIAEDIAWLYFQTCCSILERNNETSLWSRLEDFPSCSSQEERERLKDRCTVDLLKFLLFLYIQHSQVISLKAPLVSGEEWPTRARSPEPDGRAGPAGLLKGHDEHGHLLFVQNNLTDIVDLLIEPGDLRNSWILSLRWKNLIRSVMPLPLATNREENYAGSLDGDFQLTGESLKALQFLISGAKGSEVHSLEYLATLQSESPRTGYSKISRSFSFKKLILWLRNNLKNNAFGIAACLSAGQKLRGRMFSGADDSLSTSLNASLGEELFRQAKGNFDWYEIQSKVLSEGDLSSSFRFNQGGIVNKIITNANYAPEKERLMVLNQVCKRLVARSGEPVADSTVTIYRCQHSFLYLLAPLRAVMVEKCHNTVIVLGAVETVVHLKACENIQLITVARRLIVSNSRNCNFHVAIQTRPVLTGINEGLRFAPYYTFYPSLLHDMQSVGIGISPIFWNEPLVLDSTKDPSEQWKEMEDEHFHEICIPLGQEGTTVSCPWKLPQKYERALNVRNRSLEEWHHLVREAGLNRSQRQQLQSLVQNKFQEWLKESGNQQLLETLAPSGR